jgi:uncharacterized membrane protein YgdD (TMEM256/DUF423 family)
MRFGMAGALSGFLAVLAGAFGAHALRSRLDPAHLQIFETAARYQLIHALALVLVSVLPSRSASGALRWSGGLFLAGTVLFSGSLYALALTGLPMLGAITPLGGVCFLLGWLALARALYMDARVL